MSTGSGASNVGIATAAGVVVNGRMPASLDDRGRLINDVVVSVLLVNDVVAFDNDDEFAVVVVVAIAVVAIDALVESERGDCSSVDDVADALFVDRLNSTNALRSRRGKNDVVTPMPSSSADAMASM